MTSRVLIIRHGHTAGNGHHYVGREDLTLDEVGVEQARAAAQSLAGEAIDAVFTSRLSRSQQTATPIALPRGLPLRVRGELDEIDYGIYHGLPKADKPISLKRDFRYRRMPGGESLHDVFTRVRRVAAELRECAGTTVVVGHFRSNQMLVAALMGIGFEAALSGDYKPANGSIYEIRTDPTGSAAHWIETH